jgi:hypothetical protein
MGDPSATTINAVHDARIVMEEAYVATIDLEVDV